MKFVGALTRQICRRHYRMPQTMDWANPVHTCNQLLMREPSTSICLVPLRHALPQSMLQPFILGITDQGYQRQSTVMFERRSLLCPKNLQLESQYLNRRALCIVVVISQGSKCHHNYLAAFDAIAMLQSDELKMYAHYPTITSPQHFFSGKTCKIDFSLFAESMPKHSAIVLLKQHSGDLPVHPQPCTTFKTALQGLSEQGLSIPSKYWMGCVVCTSSIANIWPHLITLFAC